MAYTVIRIKEANGINSLGIGALITADGPRRACDRCGAESYQTRIINGSDTPGAPRLLSVCMPRHGCRAYTPQVRPA